MRRLGTQRAPTSSASTRLRCSPVPAPTSLLPPRHRSRLRISRERESEMMMKSRFMGDAATPASIVAASASGEREVWNPRETFSSSPPRHVSRTSPPRPGRTNLERHQKRCTQGYTTISAACSPADAPPPPPFGSPADAHLPCLFRAGVGGAVRHRSAAMCHLDHAHLLRVHRQPRVPIHVRAPPHTPPSV